jgi:hypothetical protein
MRFATGSPPGEGTRPKGKEFFIPALGCFRNRRKLFSIARVAAYFTA